MKKKTLWVITMLGLCLVLYTIVLSRMEASTNVIFGGSENAFIQSDSVNFGDLNVQDTPEPTVDIWPALTTSDFENNPQYSLVNNENLLSSAYEPEVSKISVTRYMMFRTEYMQYIDAFLQAIQDAGYTPYIAAAYRSYSFQNHLFNSKASQIAYGLGITDYLDPEYQKAADEARTIVAFPGSSEHQLGLAVDILDRERTKLVYGDMDQEFFAWLDSHCAEYGFIKRYPTKKLLLTGWDEPWHYRYVGKEVATFITEQDICYEEFYAHYFPDFEY